MSSEAGRATVVEPHLQIENQVLADPPLPIVDADQGVDRQPFDENLVHCGYQPENRRPW